MPASTSRLLSVSLLAVILVCAMVSAAYAAADSEDDGSQSFGMHACPGGSALRGIDASKNRFFCLQVDDTSQQLSVDTDTERKVFYDGSTHSMHACPQGSYVTGWSDSKNLLLCALQGPLKFTGTESVDSGSQELEQHHGSRTMHVCVGPNALSIVTGINGDDNKLLCQGIQLANTPSPTFTDTEDDGQTQLADMHACPVGTAVAGMDVSDNRFLCRTVGESKSDLFVDYSTIRQNLRACPQGTYLRGYQQGHDELLCAYDISRGESTFVGDEFLEPAKNSSKFQKDGMHACPAVNGLPSYIVGTDSGGDHFLCRTMLVPGAWISGSIQVPGSFDPTQSRGFLKLVPSVFSTSTWQAITRNWLTHILNLPMPGDPGDPRCAALFPPLSEFSSRFGESTTKSGNAACDGVAAPILKTVLFAPATQPPDCSNSSNVTLDKNGFVSRAGQPTGVQQFLLRYQSPVNPGLVASAYLNLPPGFNASGSFPAVLVTHGHEDHGKESTARCPDDPDHGNALALAEAGAITLAPDTISFRNYQTGEFDVANVDSVACTSTHWDDDAHYQTACAIRSGTLMQRYLLDNIARVSILENIKGVDRTRVSTAGLSLGGYQALWTAALDTRISRIVTAGMFRTMQAMESPDVNHRCQEVPSLSTDFLADRNRGTISNASLLIETEDIAGLIFPRFLLSTWGASDPDIGQRGNVFSQTISILKTTGGFFVERIVPNFHHEFLNDEAEPFLLRTPPTVP